MYQSLRVACCGGFPCRQCRFSISAVATASAPSPVRTLAGAIGFRAFLRPPDSMDPPQLRGGGRHRDGSISAQGCRRVSPDSRGQARGPPIWIGSTQSQTRNCNKVSTRPTGSGGVAPGSSHLLLTGRTARAFSRVSSTSSVSWRITRRSPSRSAYSTLSRLISTSSSWPR